MKLRQIGAVAWGLVTLVVILALLVWSQVRLTGSSVTIYDVFPVLGLSAFSIMWCHYVVGALAKYVGDEKSRGLARFYKITEVIVLFLLLLHPGLLIVNLWFDGFGLPPFSYLQAYPGIVHGFALLLGTMSLLAFLAFEFHRKFGQKSWWKYVDYASMAAMAAIFFHALLLGGELAVTWFKAIWLFYGVTLIGAIIYGFQQKKEGS